MSSSETLAQAFPQLTDREMRLVEGFAQRQAFKDGETIFQAGQDQLDFIVVERGKIEIINPSDHGAHVAWHGPGHFAGDIDLLTGRAVIVDGISRGETVVLRVPHAKFRHLLNSVPSLGEKLLDAVQARRSLLDHTGKAGIRIIGGANCSHTTLVREFLHKNFVPNAWFDPDTDAGAAALRDCGIDPAAPEQKFPAVRFASGDVLHCPSLRDLADRAGVWKACPTDTFDLAIVGAGPSGMAAAVYAASEGLSVIVLDRLGPGGQAGDSSKIENFIGFPSGLSGTELATRAVLQMFKFGATMVCPVEVTQLDPAPSAAEPHQLHIDCGGVVKARTVLIAVGVTWRKLQARNAWRFERKGIYYACTSVESDMHAGQDVAVVGAGNSAGQAAMFLAERCERTVHLFVRGNDLQKGMSSYLSTRVEKAPNIRIHFGVEIDEVLGDGHVEAVKLKGKSNDTLTLGGIFVFIGSEPHAQWLPDSVVRDEQGYLITGGELLRSGRWPVEDRSPCPLETSIPRVLAGGDARRGSTKRVGFAVGDGSLAVTCAHALRTNDP